MTRPEVVEVLTQIGYRPLGGLEDANHWVTNKLNMLTVFLPDEPLTEESRLTVFNSEMRARFKFDTLRPIDMPNLVSGNFKAYQREVTKQATDGEDATVVEEATAKKTTEAVMASLFDNPGE